MQEKAKQNQKPVTQQLVPVVAKKPIWSTD